MLLNQMRRHQQAAPSFKVIGQRPPEHPQRIIIEVEHGPGHGACPQLAWTTITMAFQRNSAATWRTPPSLASLVMSICSEKAKYRGRQTAQVTRPPSTTMTWPVM